MVTFRPCGRQGRGDTYIFPLNKPIQDISQIKSTLLKINYAIFLKGFGSCSDGFKCHSFPFLLHM